MEKDAEDCKSKLACTKQNFADLAEQLQHMEAKERDLKRIKQENKNVLSLFAFPFPIGPTDIDHYSSVMDGLDSFRSSVEELPQCVLLCSCWQSSWHVSTDCVLR